MTKNKYFLIILMIFLLFIIPTTSANDNTTDIIEIDKGDSISDDNLLNENVGNTENILSDASPHKELTDDDLKNDSKIYLTNGEYDYSKEYYEVDYGLFSNSGYGDGGYDVYANKERTAFTIVFIDWIKGGLRNGKLYGSNENELFQSNWWR